MEKGSDNYFLSKHTAIFLFSSFYVWLLDDSILLQARHELIHDFAWSGVNLKVNGNHEIIAQKRKNKRG